MSASRFYTDPPLPFRWDIARRDTLGGILREESDDTRYRTNYEGFLGDLLACAARTVALAGDSDLVFIGRGPESLFDLLAGLTAGTAWRQERSLTLLRFSIGHADEDAARRAQPEPLAAFRLYMETLGLSPARLIARERPIALIDLVCNGETMEVLLRLIHDWTREERADSTAVLRKLRIVGIVNRHDEEPPRPRWKQRRDAAFYGYAYGRPSSWHDDAWIGELLESGAMRELPISSRLWNFIGNDQVKSTPSYPPELWGEEGAAHPDHHPYYLAGLRAARRIYEAGSAAEVRERFAALLAAEETAMRSACCRKLVREIRKQ